LQEIDRPKRDYDQDGTVFDHDGLVDVEATIRDRQWDQEYRGDYIEPKPVPKKAGKIDAKTIARRAASELTDCGSHKSVRVMLYRIDGTNRGSGHHWAANATIGRKVHPPVNEKAVKRANNWWCQNGHEVNGEWMPFLKLVRPGHIKADGTKRASTYEVQFEPFFALAAKHSSDAELRQEAAKMLESVTRNVTSGTSMLDKSVQR
jgi:hypothetical protein